MVVLSMITKNSLEKVGSDFEKVWQSSLQVPYDLILLVDDSDNDKTRRFVENFAKAHGKEIVVLKSKLYGWHKPTRATARQTAIDAFFENTDEEWLFFLDDDFILGRGWWDIARRYMDHPDVGLIWGIDYTPRWTERIKWIRTRGLSEREYAIYSFNVRGGLHDTLLRRGAIEGVKIPPWLHVYEDAWIKKFAECKNFKPIIIDVPGNTHLRASGEGYDKADVELMLKVSACLKLENVNLVSVFKALFGLPGYVFYARKAGMQLSEGFRIWKARASWRLKHIIWQLKCRSLDTCTAVSNIREMEKILKLTSLYVH